MPWFNGPKNETRGQMALVGGPYESLEEAKAQLQPDRDLCEATARDGARYAAFGSWLAVELPRDDYRTLRRTAAGECDGIDTVATTGMAALARPVAAAALER